jgi:hypothetical protein
MDLVHAAFRIPGDIDCIRRLAGHGRNGLNTFRFERAPHAIDPENHDALQPAIAEDRRRDIVRRQHLVVVDRQFQSAQLFRLLRGGIGTTVSQQEIWRSRGAERGERFPCTGQRPVVAESRI